MRIVQNKGAKDEQLRSYKRCELCFSGGTGHGLHNGTTQTTEKIVNPESEYLKLLPQHLRSYDDVLHYIPNQVYIGNMTNSELADVEFPYYDKKAPEGKRYGKYGEIMPQDEFIGLMQICDAFDLVKLESGFAQDVKAKLEAHGMLKAEQISILDKNQETEADIEKARKRGTRRSNLS